MAKVISEDDLFELGKYLDLELESSGTCYHSHEFTRKFLEVSGFDVEESLKWLIEKGGHCDCEIVLNLITDE